MQKNTTITKDTIFLTTISLFLQGISLLLNVFITRKIGTEGIGIVSLILTFYSFALVLSNGNIFTSTSRFVSEEIGKSNGNVSKVMKFSLIFGIILSSICAVIILVFSEKLGNTYLKSANSVVAIRLLAFSLPLATIGSCLKGYFHARRLVKIPSLSDVLEFIVKSVVMAFGVVFLMPNKVLGIFTIISISIILGEIVSSVYLSVIFLIKSEKSRGTEHSSTNFSKYFMGILPIIVNAYVFAVLSSANDALVPLTLHKFSHSTGVALSEYGIFEAIIMPVIFFPSIILQSLSCILVPEISREKSAKNLQKINNLTKKVLTDTFSLAILVSTVLFAFGTGIGELFCENILAGNTLKILCPVIPFIYLEIVLEGILKGLGKQNFSTLISGIEYLIRLLAVVIFVPIIGFNGIIISYFSSNILCNIIRMIKVLRETSTKFDLKNFILFPFFTSIFSLELTKLFTNNILTNNFSLKTVISVIIITILYILLSWIINKLLKSRKNTLLLSKKGV
ncbi:MAG: oligosaccharide flippase family protein [Oscillospiraceae bacterium]